MIIIYRRVTKACLHSYYLQFIFCKQAESKLNKLNRKISVQVEYRNSKIIFKYKLL